MGRPEGDWARRIAMSVLGSGLSEAGQHEDALIVYEAELAMVRRLGAPEESMLVTQSNLASTYQYHGRLEEALRLKRDVYSGYLRLFGDEHLETIRTAYNYAVSLLILERFTEARALLLETMPVARRVLGESHDLMLKMRWVYGKALYRDGCATLDDLREAVTRLEDIERIARRVLGGAHPVTASIDYDLREARAVLRGANANESHFPIGAQVS